jgi:dihydrofolate reductase
VDGRSTSTAETRETSSSWTSSSRPKLSSSAVGPTSPQYVVSSTLEEPPWENSTVISGDVAGEVSKLKAEPGGNILVAGSVQLVRTLLDNDLVDELRLMVFPVVLGKGKRLFDDGLGKSALKLVEARAVGPEGVVVLVYRPAEDSAAAGAAAA